MEAKRYTVQRGNVILEVTDNELDKYLHNGYDIIDVSTGKVLQESVYGKDANTLRSELEKYKKKYEALLKENEELKAKLSAPPAPKKTTTKKSTDK